MVAWDKELVDILFYEDRKKTEEVVYVWNG
jgi:hypothetical protein